MTPSVTRIIMSATAIVFIFLGVAFSFAPAEIATAAGWDVGSSILLQITGALYLGFGMINWTARANLIGGIYGRPVALGNFMHFMVAALALVKYISAHEEGRTALGAITVAYAIFALIFGYVFFSHPKLKTNA